MGVIRIRGVEQARRLAADLNSGSRDRPYVVVSTPAAQSSPFIDAEGVFEDVGDLARVYVLPTGDESWAFTKDMPHLTQVYGGAGRVYPVGTSWVVDPYQSPLRFAFDKSEGERATQQLIADALRMSSAAGLVSRGKSPPVSVGAEIKSLVPPTRAIVRTTDGRHASIWLELLFPEAEVDQVFRVGMRLDGRLDPDTKRYDVTSMLVPPDEALRSYQPGDVVLAEVVEAQQDQATLRLHPRVSTTVLRGDVTSNELDHVSSLMTAGEVLPARVVQTGPSWRLTLLDVEDDEQPRSAPSLLRGGPPWLSQPAPVQSVPVAGPPSDLLETLVLAPEALEEIALPEPVPAPEPIDTVTTARPSPLMFDRRRSAQRPTVEVEAATLRRERDKAVSAKQRAEQHNASLQRDLANLRNERQLMHNALEQSKAEAQRLHSQLSQSRTELRKARQHAQRTRRRGRQERRFLDPEEEFRHEVLLAWVDRVPAAEKPQRPLPDYAIGRYFLRSVAAIEGVERSKIADVAFEVITGLAERLAGRDMHQLRTNESGDAPPVVREDGARCWRVALQVNTPQARRLHFWRLRDGRVELSRVVMHDDFTP